MGAAQSIPIVGEVVTVVDAAARTVAAGGAAICGQTNAAENLIKSAGQSFIDYSERNAIAANVNVLVNHLQGNNDRVDEILKKQGQAWTNLGENTPVVGHVVGVVRYATGDKEGGDRAMIGSTRTSVIIGATIATGGGALVVGGVAVASAAVYDGVATGINSAANGEYRPVGYVR
jgi:hypothetical protein